MIVEQFINCLPERIATNITEQKVTTAAAAAMTADEYMLLHKSNFREHPVACDSGWRGNDSDVSFEMQH